MDTKNIKIEVLTNKERTDIYGVVINDISYTRKANETISEFFTSVDKEVKASQGFDFIQFYKNPKNSNSIKPLTVELINDQSQEPRQKYTEKKQAKGSLKKRITAVAVAATLLLTSVVGFSHVNKFNKAENSFAKTQTEQSVIVEDNAQLKAIYEKLAKTKHGEKIIKELQQMDKWQEAYNTKLAKYPDADGDVIFLKAREVSAMQDMSNATNTSFISLDYDDTRFCDYLEAASYTTPGLYVSERKTGEYKLIWDDATRQKMLNEEEFAISAIKGNESTSSINKHFKELMETGLTYPEAGVNTAYLGEGSNIVVSDQGQNSKKLEEFIKLVKTNNSGANKLDSYAKAKLDLTDTQRTLIDEAYKAMDGKNISVSLDKRDKFDMETTEKGLEMHATIVGGGYLIGGGSTYTYVTKSGKRVQISKAEAIKKFGASAVREAERKADSNIKVDTNGDGKTDTYMDEANKKEEQKHQELEKEADNYEADYAQGQADGYAGRGKAKNTAGYNAGYANGQKKKAAEEAPDEIITQEESYDIPTQNQSTPEVKQVIEVESNGETYKTEIAPTTSKVRSYGAMV